MNQPSDDTVYAAFIPVCIKPIAAGTPELIIGVYGSFCFRCSAFRTGVIRNRIPVIFSALYIAVVLCVIAVAVVNRFNGNDFTAGDAGNSFYMRTALCTGRSKRSADDRFVWRMTECFCLVMLG